MYQNYLITGATGFLGSAVVQLLLAHGCRVLALVKDRDPLIYTLPNHVAVFTAISRTRSPYVTFCRRRR